MGAYVAESMEAGGGGGIDDPGVKETGPRVEMENAERTTMFTYLAGLRSDAFFAIMTEPPPCQYLANGRSR